MKDATADILCEVESERISQIELKGWTREHDDSHGDGILAQAAACYALRATPRKDQAHDMWPFDDEWWKPKDARRDLIRAAALIVAEVERLDRAALQGSAEVPQK